MKYIILDLDNCIADDAWRIPQIRWQKTNPTERYHDYHSLSGFDKVANEDLLCTPVGIGIIICTARPLAYHAVTKEWLRRNDVGHWHLLMRNNNDHRSSVDIKRGMLRWLEDLYAVGRDSIVAAYDDREDIVQMYREEGVHGVQRAVHSVCAYSSPDELEEAR
jgi:hypothetical protein